jgi:hypothetical protein
MIYLFISSSISLSPSSLSLSPLSSLSSSPLSSSSLSPSHYITSCTQERLYHHQLILLLLLYLSSYVGSNDLGHGIHTPDNITHNLITLHSMVHSMYASRLDHYHPDDDDVRTHQHRVIYTMAVSIPPIHNPALQYYKDENRIYVNDRYDDDGYDSDDNDDDDGRGGDDDNDGDVDNDDDD